jgi:hypothetical protein
MAGNIRIIEPTDNYQKVSKGIIFNQEIDTLTLGIYVRVLAMGKKWELNVKGLASTISVSADKIRFAFASLEKAGYLRRKRVQGTHGRFSGWDYEISSVPFTDIAKTPTSVNTDIGENRIPENGEDIYRDNIQDRDNTENRDKRVVFHRPTIQQVRDYCKERNNNLDPDYFYDKMEAVGWTLKSGQTVKDWRAVIRTWEKYDTTPENTTNKTRTVSLEELRNR